MKMNPIDLKGQRFGKLVAIKKSEPHFTVGGHKQTVWLCKCDCGQITRVQLQSLRNGRTKSCGCLRFENPRTFNTKHGMRNTKIYKKWAGMKNRCFNPNTERFGDYGGRGITVCEEWKDDFQAFYDYVSQLPHFGEEGYSLDRINNDGNYEPGNVRWATAKEQNQNQRKRRKRDGVKS